MYSDNVKRNLHTGWGYKTIEAHTAHTLNGEGVCGGRGYALCDHLDEWWVDLHETEHLIKD